MTFQKFEQIFRTKYPNGVISRHCKGQGMVGKVCVDFDRENSRAKVYTYYGAYEDVLCRMGINVISKERLAEEKLRLETLKERNGKPSMFFSDRVTDNSEEIARLEKRIAEYESEWIVA